MEQRKLYRTIETLASKEFSNEKELLIEVLNQILNNEEIEISGGRIWKLNSEKKSYSLLFQRGKVQKIRANFLLKISDYPIFELIASERTILANETNKTLIRKGIFKYSASGIGNKIKLGSKSYYEYLLAVNSNHIDDELFDTLNIVATVLTAQIKAKRVSTARRHLIADIDKAKLLQKSLLPEHEFRFHNYDLFGVTVPAETLGGDFFDYLKIGDEEDRLGIVLGDVASKGLAAAAEAMYISGALRMTTTFQLKISPLMNRMNELVNKIFSDDKFASLFYGEISTDKKGLFLYANAGHNPPIFIKKNLEDIAYLDATGPLLGPAPHSKYDTDSINFEIGDVLVIYSDGIVESADSNFELYSVTRLEKIIIKNINLSPKDICYKILEDVNNFSTSDSKYQDDKTLVVIKKKG